MLKYLKGKVFFAITVIPVSVYVVAIASLYSIQEQLIFPGAPLSASHQFHFNVPFEELNFSVKGAELNALHFKQSEPRGLVFFLHGNVGNLETWTTAVKYYQRVNYDMFIFDYRGYGKSTGHIQSESQLHRDVRQAWDFIAPHYKDKPIVIYGRSLGTALAVSLARDVNPDLLVLVSAFNSLEDMAQKRFPWVPDGVLRYPLRTNEIISDVQSKIVLMHGDEDTFIPISHSHKLHALIKVSSTMIVIKGAGHNDIHSFDRYLDGLTAVLPD